MTDPKIAPYDACAICGEQVATRTRIEGFSGWEAPDGEIVGREVVAVVHPECYTRATPGELEALIDRATKDRRA
jgi:hypothetical protein